MSDQNVPGYVYRALSNAGALMEWQRNYLTEIEHDAAVFKARSARGYLENRIGKELAYLRNEQSAGLRNTVVAGIEILETALNEVRRELASRPPMDPAKMRVHMWER